MKVKIRPMQEKDFIKTAGAMFVTQPDNSSNASAVAMSIFGNPVNKPDPITKHKSVDIYYKTGVIKLAISYANYFLCGKNLALLNKMMPRRMFSDRFDKICVATIMNCEYIYDLDEHDFINVNSGNNMTKQYDSSRYLIGGDCLKFFMERFNVEAEIELEILNIGVTCLGSAAKATMRNTKMECFDKEKIRVTTVETPFHFIDKYYLKVEQEKRSNGSIYDPNFDDELVSAFTDTVNKNVISKITSHRLCYLLQMRNKNYYENFLNLVQGYIAVLPLGYRLGTETEQSTITQAYNKLIQANIKLSNTLLQGSHDIQRVVNDYKELIKWIKYVTIDHKAVQNPVAGYRSLVESIVGKQGTVRSKLQSVVVDNAGRSVIVADTYMSIDSVGVPYTMLREMCDVAYLKYLDRREELFNSKGTNKNTHRMTPKDKLQKLEEFKSDANFNKMKEFIDKLCDVEGVQQDITYKICREIYPRFMITFGRQPTLYRLGIQAFKAVPVEGNAIRVAPLCVLAFNADFDGDQMHLSLPVSIEAQNEVADLMSNIKNIYFPRDGSCHIYPRHEIIYGLWYASKQKPDGDVVINAPKLTDEVRQMIFDMVMYDQEPLNSAVVIGGYTWSLGQIAVKCCAGTRYADYIIGSKTMKKANKLYSNRSTPIINDEEDGICTDKWCKQLLTLIHDESQGGERLFIETVNNYTQIGTCIATNYPMDINLMDLPDISKYVNEFESDVKDVQEAYDLGFETEASYKREYGKAYGRMKDKLERALFKPDGELYVGDDNGFLQMWKSGCRGSGSTMFQMFAMKGRMQKNSQENFNAIITSSMSTGLSGLAHMVTAYGGRQGQIDKSIETATPGYLYRTMLHSDCSFVITELDCGTTKGLLLNWEFLKMMIGEANAGNSIVFKKAESMFTDLVTDRYLVEKPDGVVERDSVSGKNGIFRAMVADYDVTTDTITVKPGVHLRSIITCSNPCCARCYGKDLGRHTNPKIRMAIGEEAAQSIGEPAAQLILKNFQKGGVASEGGLTSAFGLIQHYIKLQTIDKAKAREPKSTDIVSPYTGEVKELYLDNMTKQVDIVDANGKPLNRVSYYFYSGIPLKSYVHRGETLMIDIGDLELDNVRDVLGTDYMILYLTVKLWQIFIDQGVNVKHFEVLVASMIHYNCKVSFENFKAGLAYNLIEYWRDGGYKSPESFYITVYGVDRTPHVSNDALRGFFFERQTEAISQHVLRSDEDTLTDNYVRLSLGLPVDVK